MTAPFGANNTLKRRRSDSNFARGTNLFSSHDNVTPKAGKRTLFGAVMQRTSGSTGASTPTKQRSNDAAAAASTPIPNGRASWNNVTTPSSSRSKSFLSANSPCGFALLKVLESVASPFRHNDETSDEESPVPDTKIEEWQEGFLRKDSIGVVDWSIKRKLRLECHPRSCLPQASDWEGARSYWQHPAMYPLPTFEGQENETSQSTREVSATMHPLSHLVDMVRGRDALLHRLVRQDPRLWKERRNREWQEAFRSLYFKWIEQVEALQQAWENGDHISPETVTRTYFYAMTPGQTILFRVGMDPSNDSSNERPLIVPIIVLSSTTFHLRSKLRSMGAKLFYSYDQKVEFEEAVLERRKAEKTTQDETDNVHQELEALRRAQAHGQTAGADVSIATKTKTTTKSPRSVPPLCLIGDEDCFAFFEFYLNTLGRGTTWLQGNGDVPLLLSRKVGPFAHASLQSLPVTSRREASESQDKSTDDNHAAIDLRGPILPCAMVELVCTAASRNNEKVPAIMMRNAMQPLYPESVPIDAKCIANMRIKIKALISKREYSEEQLWNLPLMDSDYLLSDELQPPPSLLGPNVDEDKAAFIDEASRQAR